MNLVTLGIVIQTIKEESQNHCYFSRLTKNNHPKPMANEEVLKKIAEERKNRTGVLDLSWGELQEIPEEILELSYLQSLNLLGSKITDISFLERLPNLQSCGAIFW